MGTDLAEALLVVADVIHVNGLVLTVFLALDDATDAGTSMGSFAQVTGIRQHGLEELQGHNLHAIVHNGVNAGHAHIFKHGKMIDVVGGEAHPELGTFNGGNVLDQGLHLLVVHAVNLIRTHTARAGKRLVHAHGTGLLEVTVFPVAAGSRYLTDVDFRVKVSGKSLSVVATVHVNDVQVLNLVKMMLERPCGVHIGHTGVEPGTEQGIQAGLFEAVLVRPLPAVLKLGNIAGLIISGIQIIDTGLQAGIHQRQILIRQGHVKNEVGLHLLNEGNRSGHIISVHGMRGNLHTAAGEHVCGNRIALALGTGCQMDVLVYICHLGTLVSHYMTHTTCSDYEYSVIHCPQRVPELTLNVK